MCLNHLARRRGSDLMFWQLSSDLRPQSSLTITDFRVACLCFYAKARPITRTTVTPRGADTDLRNTHRPSEPMSTEATAAAIHTTSFVSQFSASVSSLPTPPHNFPTI